MPASEPQVPGAGNFVPIGPNVANPTTNHFGNTRSQFEEVRFIA